MSGRLLWQTVFRVLLTLTLGLSIALMWVPGFNRLNYYFSLASALTVSIFSAICGGSILRTFRRAGPRTSTAAPLKQAVGAALIFALVPLLVVTVASAWIKNCNYLGGLKFYLFQVGCSAMLSAVFGLVVATALPRWSELWIFFGWLGWLAWVVIDLYIQPRITLYLGIVGFYSGAIYDEVIETTATFMRFRLLTLSQVALLVALLNWGVDPRSWHLQWRRLRGAGAVALTTLGLLSALTITLLVLGGWWGYSYSRGDVERILGGKRETPHFLLVYSEGATASSRVDEWLDDHQFRRHQLVKYMALKAPRRITSTIYPSAAVKRQLMGAAHTYIAKPWLDEIHLNAIPLGRTVLAHELAHAYAAEFARGPLKIATRFWFWPNMALVEGLAMAAEWNSGDYTPHQWTAAMFELKAQGKPVRVPDIVAIMNPANFWQHYSRNAYTTSGSFVRFVIAQYGVERFKGVYAGATFQGSYGKDLTVLAGEWQRFLTDRKQVPLDKTILSRTAEMFTRRSVLHRVCGNEIARLESLIAAANGRGDYPGALTIHQRILRYLPRHPHKQLGYALALMRVGRYKDARKLARSLLARGDVPLALQGLARVALADIHWWLDEKVEAIRAYSDVIALALDRGTSRASWVKIKAIQNADWGPLLRELMLNASLGTWQRTELLLHLMEQEGDVPLLQYLTARQLYVKGRYREAAGIFEQLNVQALPDPDFGVESYRLAGQALYLVGETKRAAALFKRILARYRRMPRGLRNQIADWLERCEWKQGQAVREKR